MSLLFCFSSHQLIANCQIQIYDMMGKCIYEQTVSHQLSANSYQPLTIDLSEVPQGIYSLEITSDKSCAIYKIIVAR
jgi:hypothetical protein